MTTDRPLKPIHIEALAAIDRLGTTPPPSLRELADELLIDHKAAAKRRDALVAAGALEVQPRGHRSMRITPAGRAQLEQAAAHAPELPGSEYRAWKNRYVWSHARDAVRTWWGWRKGLTVDRARSGKAQGRPAALEDVARVGRVLQAYSPEQQAQLVSWAKGATSTTDNRLEHLVDRLTRRLRQLKLVSRAVVIGRAHRTTWRASDGQEMATTAFLGVDADCDCKVPGDVHT